MKTYKKWLKRKGVLDIERLTVRMNERKQRDDMYRYNDNRQRVADQQLQNIIVQGQGLGVMTTHLTSPAAMEKTFAEFTGYDL